MGVYFRWNTGGHLWASYTGPSLGLPGIALRLGLPFRCGPVRIHSAVCLSDRGPKSEPSGITVLVLDSFRVGSILPYPDRPFALWHDSLVCTARLFIASNTSYLRFTRTVLAWNAKAQLGSRDVSPRIRIAGAQNIEDRA